LPKSDRFIVQNKRALSEINFVEGLIYSDVFDFVLLHLFQI